MEIKTLITGLLFSIGIFAAKSGIGLNYCISTRRNFRTKALLTAVFSLIYLALFNAAFQVLSRMDILNYYDRIAGLMASGMTIHILLAVLMTTWGTGLLKTGSSHETSGSWLLLVLPCPVCITVIFFTVALCLALAPDSGTGVIFAAWGGFMLTVFATGLIAAFFKRTGGTDSETLLGASMIGISVYFMLSVCIMPVFSDAAKIYSIAGYQAGSESNYSRLLWAAGAVALLMGEGIRQKRKKMAVV